MMLALMIRVKFVNQMRRHLGPDREWREKNRARYVLTNSANTIGSVSRPRCLEMFTSVVSAQVHHMRMFEKVSDGGYRIRHLRRLVTGVLQESAVKFEALRTQTLMEYQSLQHIYTRMQSSKTKKAHAIKNQAVLNCFEASDERLTQFLQQFCEKLAVDYLLDYYLRSIYELQKDM